MQIVLYLHLFPPEHNAGSETTVHAAMRAMVRRGHDVKVICDRSVTAPYEIDGIQVVRPPRRGQQRWLQDFVKDADLLVTHLDLTSQAMQLALAVRKSLVHFVHNDAQLLYWRVNTLKAQLVVFNSYWIAEKACKWGSERDAATLWPGPSVVVHPIVEPEYYRCERGDAITLVNPTPGKGVATFRALAELMPDNKFLAVAGGYGEQKITEPYANVEWMPHTPDIREVFRKTRVLLMPSDYESYGRVGIEAACAGIPTIAHPTIGLKEAFGDAAVFIDRNDVPAWHVELERLFNDDIYYQHRSQAALTLADSLDPESEFDRLEQAFIETVERWTASRKDAQMNIWVCDRKIWKTRTGFAEEINGRIPQDAVSLYAGIGTEVPRHVAVAQGWIGDSSRILDVTEETRKAIEKPAENKAFSSPEENKNKKARAA